jgi:hypothetical protein
LGYNTFFDADADPGIFSTLDQGSGMEKFGSGIRVKHHGSATLDSIKPILKKMEIRTIFSLYHPRKKNKKKLPVTAEIIRQTADFCKHATYLLVPERVKLLAKSKQMMQLGRNKLEDKHP